MKQAAATVCIVFCLGCGARSELDFAELRSADGGTVDDADATPVPSVDSGSIARDTSIADAATDATPASTSRWQLAVGGAITCALRKTDGVVFCWGDVPTPKALPGERAGLMQQLRAKRVPDLKGVRAITANQNTVYALLADGTVSAWGVAAFLGTEDGVAHTPVTVPGLTEIVQIASGTAHDSFLRADGVVFSQGNNEYEEVGDGTADGSHSIKFLRLTPVQIVLPSVMRIASGARYGMALTADGRVYEWGASPYSFPGSGLPDQFASPVPVAGISEVASLARGSCVLTTSSTVRCWGCRGQCTKTSPFRGEPFDFPEMKGAVSVSGSGVICARMSDETLRCFGNNQHGQIGDGTVSLFEAKPRVPTLDRVVEFDSSLWTSCAERRDDGIYCWGLNDLGQLGDGTKKDSPVPRKVMFDDP